MSKQTINFEDYVSAREIGDELFEALGGPKMGGYTTYKRVGNQKLPQQGGNVTLMYNECYRHKSDHISLYILKFKVPKVAVLRWARIDPDMNPWDAVATKFTVEGNNISKDLVERVKQGIANNRISF